MHSLEQTFFDQVSQNKIDSGFLLEFSRWLQAQGDPRGEIMALEVTLEAQSADDSTSTHERLKVLKQEAVLHLEATIDFPKYVDPKFDFTWQYGFVTGVALSPLDPDGILDIENAEDVKEIMASLENMSSFFESDYSKFVFSVELSDMNITDTPSWLGKLTQLTYLDLNSNALTVFPESIKSLVNLQTLDLYYNELTLLPDWLGQLSKLKTLALYHNLLTSLPASIGDLGSLCELYLSNNQITELPASLGNLSALTDLTIHTNNLTRLPESLGKLKQLKRLDVRGNELASVPGFLEKWVNLDEQN